MCLLCAMRDMSWCRDSIGTMKVYSQFLCLTRAPPVVVNTLFWSYMFVVLLFLMYVFQVYHLLLHECSHAFFCFIVKGKANDANIS